MWLSAGFTSFQTEQQLLVVTGSWFCDCVGRHITHATSPWCAPDANAAPRVSGAPVKFFTKLFFTRIKWRRRWPGRRPWKSGVVRVGSTSGRD